MKTQFTFLLVILCVNISAFMVMNTMKTDGTPIVPGVQYVQPINASGSISDYEKRFNTTETVDEWSASPFSGIPIIGDLFTGLSQFYDQFKFLMDGIPALLDWFGSFLPVQATTFTVIAWAVRIITGIMFVTLVIEFVSGRELMK